MTITCDGCGAEATGLGNAQANIETARVAARKLGWICTDTHDWCPWCAADGGEGVREPRQPVPSGPPLAEQLGAARSFPVHTRLDSPIDAGRLLAEVGARG